MRQRNGGGDCKGGGDDDDGDGGEDFELVSPSNVVLLLRSPFQVSSEHLSLCLHRTE